MSTIGLSIPIELQTLVESAAEHAGYAPPGQYIETVVREVWKQSAKAELEDQIAEGLNSGPAFEVTPQFWQGLEDRLREASCEA